MQRIVRTPTPISEIALYELEYNRNDFFNSKKIIGAETPGGCRLLIVHNRSDGGGIYSLHADLSGREINFGSVREFIEYEPMYNFFLFRNRNEAFKWLADAAI